LIFDEETGIWEVQEHAERSHLTPERQEIVDLLKKTPGPWRLLEIAKALGKKRSTLVNLMNSLIEQRIAERIRYGQYQLKS
jgi:Mn-dependent DtxR family transcriptional regulator